MTAATRTTEVRPLTADRWPDLERVFGPNGACAGCWCTWWRQTSREFETRGSTGNRALLRGLVADGAEPGLLAYRDDEPVGWVSVGPRPQFGRLLRSPLFAPDDHDDADVWAVVCFTVPRAHRRAGLTDVLLAGAIDHAAARGARVVEGYPKVVGPTTTSADLFVGTPSLFARHGFAEVARPSPTRAIVRRDL